MIWIYTTVLGLPAFTDFFYLSTGLHSVIFCIIPEQDTYWPLLVSCPLVKVVDLGDNFAWEGGDYLAKLQVVQGNSPCPSYASLPVVPA